ncbi:type II secretion system protein N [Caulobacter sp. NIBR2454]|uniref:type II secretion system protein N n=1 Tax=Caulobacter sp. NIBR2454 TaxID=3015996 RepID=UPI0022B68F80|nr:type II secretion system protein N [Caulobacter sp. NIBR2454]
MNRVPLPAVFAGVFAFGLIALSPLRVAVGLAGGADTGLSVSRISGTIWGGELKDAALRELALGDLKAGLDPLALFTGKTRLRLKGDGPVAVDGGVVLGRKGLQLSHMSASAPLGALGAPSALGGQLTLKDVTVRFRGDQCRRAKGLIQVTPAQGLPPVSGQIACRGNDAVAMLEGQGDGVAMRMDIRLSAKGSYVVRTRLQASNPGLLSLFGQAGFDVGPQDATRTDAGQL